ncbi:MAG: hypothetical protein GXO39_05685 [Thermotogae bacterium]|nr:hypothetical protein [Thermotogota bacterium]
MGETLPYAGKCYPSYYPIKEFKSLTNGNLYRVKEFYASEVSVSREEKISIWLDEYGKKIV